MELIYRIRTKNGGGMHHPKRVIIHAIGEWIEHEGKIYYAHEWLNLIGLSCHYLVTPTGVVIQQQDINYIAWHAKGNNTDSIGIELLVAGVYTYETFRERIKKPYVYGEQFSSLVNLSRQYKDLEFTTHDRIDTRFENGRKVKVDPGDGFDFETFLNYVKNDKKTVDSDRNRY